MSLTEVELQRIIATVLSQTRTQITFSKLAEDYLQLHAIKKKSFKKDVGYLRNYIEPSFGNIELGAITPMQVERAFARWSVIGSTAANRALEILRVMFKLAIRWQYMAGPNPADGIKKNREKARDRYITAAEMPSLREALSKEPLDVQTAVRIYLYTACRRSEIANAKWRHVNWHERYLLIPDTKNGTNFPCPLPEVCILWLNKLPRRDEHIFPGMHPGTRLDVYKAWRRVRAVAGLEDVTIHDFRRTCGTWLLDEGFTRGEISDALNHLSPKSTERYAVYRQEKLRRMMDTASHRIENLLAPADHGNVVYLRRGNKAR